MKEDLVLEVLESYTVEERKAIEKFLDEYGELTDNEEFIAIADLIETLGE